MLRRFTIDLAARKVKTIAGTARTITLPRALRAMACTPWDVWLDGQRARLPGVDDVQSAIDALRAYHWPGNIRELENLIHRELLLADAPELVLAALPRSAPAERRVVLRRQADTPRAAPAGAAGVVFREAKARAIAEFEREYIRDLLKQSSGNVSLAARLAGKERSRFNRLVRKYRFNAREFRSPAPSPGS
jgi:DNA-binding NtrC family response regulator